MCDEGNKCTPGYSTVCVDESIIDVLCCAFVLFLNISFREKLNLELMTFHGYCLNGKVGGILGSAAEYMRSYFNALD